MNERYILELVCYSPKVYSGLDRMFVFLTKLLREQNITPIFVYGETMQYCPKIKQDLQTTGAVVLTMPEKGHKAQYNALLAIFKQYHPIVVDVHFENYIKAVSVLLSKRYKARHFTHIHSLIADSPTEYRAEKGLIKCLMLSLFYNLLYKNSEKVLCVSQAIETQLRCWINDTSGRIQTLYLGTDLTPSDFSEEIVRNRLKLNLS